MSSSCFLVFIVFFILLFTGKILLMAKKRYGFFAQNGKDRKEEEYSKTAIYLFFPASANSGSC